jgi:hypothetical protein
LSARETTERLRLLRRFGVASRSTDRFAISRTGKPSLALRAAARVLAMHASQFQQLAAADAFERGDRNDQSGVWSDSDDEGAFEGVAPATTERVWDGPSATESDGEGTRARKSDYHHRAGVFSSLPRARLFLFFVKPFVKRAFRDGRRVIMTPLWDLLGTEKFP